MVGIVDVVGAVDGASGVEGDDDESCDTVGTPWAARFLPAVEDVDDDGEDEDAENEEELGRGRDGQIGRVA